MANKPWSEELEKELLEFYREMGESGLEDPDNAFVTSDLANSLMQTHGWRNANYATFMAREFIRKSLKAGLIERVSVSRESINGKMMKTVAYRKVE